MTKFQDIWNLIYWRTFNFWQKFLYFWQQIYKFEIFDISILSNKQVRTAAATVGPIKKLLNIGHMTDAFQYLGTYISLNSQSSEDTTNIVKRIDAKL